MAGFGPAICYSRRRGKAIGREVTGLTGHLLWRNRITLLTVAVVVLYAAFIQWIWGWGTILAGWQEYYPQPHRYAAGSWGPSQSIGLIEREGRSWADPEFSE